MLVVLLCLSVVEFFCSILHYPLVVSAFAFICHAWNYPPPPIGTTQEPLKTTACRLKSIGTSMILGRVIYRGSHLQFCITYILYASEVLWYMSCTASVYGNASCALQGAPSVL